jgi:hypothetical protein
MDIEFVPDTDGSTLRFRQLSGSLKDYRGRWCVAPRGSGGGEGSLITYRARARMRYPVPGFVARYVVRQQIRRMMSALTAELRRTGLPRAGLDPGPTERLP